MVMLVSKYQPRIESLAPREQECAGDIMSRAKYPRQILNVFINQNICLCSRGQTITFMVLILNGARDV